MSLYSMFEYIHSSFPDRKRSPEYPIFSEMKSSLKLMVVFELFEGMVGFEYIHSSFPDRKRSPEYPIFSEMESSLKLVVIFEPFDWPTTFRIGIFLVFELVIFFELFDRPGSSFLKNTSDGAGASWRGLIKISFQSNFSFCASHRSETCSIEPKSVHNHFYFSTFSSYYYF